MYMYIILYYTIPSHVSLYYRALSYIFLSSPGFHAREWKGLIFGERSISLNRTERCSMERIFIGTEWNGTERFIPVICSLGQIHHRAPKATQCASKAL